jgi:hypothetical protein
VAASPLAAQVKRVWFDGANACEVVVTGPSQRLLDELRRFFDSDPEGPIVMNPLAEAGALSEPVLDFDMRPGRTWHDGTPVTAEDARASLEFLRTRDWPLPSREALRQIQALEAQNNGARLHVTFRRRHGAALCGFVNLPVLPAAWLRAHPKAENADFIAHAPPGAGAHRIATRDARSLMLAPVRQDASGPPFSVQLPGLAADDADRHAHAHGGPRLAGGGSRAAFANCGSPRHASGWSCSGTRGMTFSKTCVCVRRSRWPRTRTRSSAHAARTSGTRGCQFVCARPVVQHEGGAAAVSSGAGTPDPR